MSGKLTITDKTRDENILSCENLAYQIARERWKISGGVLDLAECKSEAILALVKSADSWPGNGKFSAWAGACMRNRLKTYVEEHTGITGSPRRKIRAGELPHVSQSSLTQATEDNEYPLSDSSKTPEAIVAARLDLSKIEAAAMKRRVRLAERCVQCREPFSYLSVLDEDGRPVNPRTHCGRRCAVVGRWEGRKKLPDADELADLYGPKGMSIGAIARRFDCSTSSVGSALKKAGVATRNHTSVSKCIECGRPVMKQTNDNGVRWGRRCRFHMAVLTAKRSRKYARARNKTPNHRWRVND